MAMAAIPFHPYTGVIDTSSKRYQAAKAMLDEGKMRKSEAQSESETQLEKLRMLLRMLGKDTSSVDELLKLTRETKRWPSATSWGSWMRTETASTATG